MMEGQIGGEVRITPLGRFMLSGMVGWFTYADAVIIDTPIVDPEVRVKIRDEQAIIARLERCRVFREYLDACAAELRDTEAKLYWSGISDALASDVDNIARSLGDT
jgi:hypothetical protein